MTLDRTSGSSRAGTGWIKMLQALGVAGLAVLVIPLTLVKKEDSDVTHSDPKQPPRRKIRVDFQYLDKTTCDRCIGSDASLERAVAIVSPELRELGVELDIRRTLVESESQARRLDFVSSPTILVDGYNIAGELHESECKACGDVCGAGTHCRVWRYDNEEHTQAPVGLIVEAILGALHGQHRGERPQAGGAVAENLKRFFAGKEAKQSAGCCETPCDR